MLDSIVRSQLMQGRKSPQNTSVIGIPNIDALKLRSLE